MPSLYLASKSPRRRELLKFLGINLKGRSCHVGPLLSQTVAGDDDHLVNHVAIGVHHDIHSRAFADLDLGRLHSKVGEFQLCALGESRNRDCVTAIKVRKGIDLLGLAFDGYGRTRQWISGVILDNTGNLLGILAVKGDSTKENRQEYSYTFHI